MEKIDIKSWARRAQYENFVGYTNPVFSVTVRLDVTKLVSFCKEKGKSFFATFLYIMSESMNEIPEWRMRIKDDEVVIFDKVHPSFVVLKDDDELATCMSEAISDYETFHDKTKEMIAKAKSEKSGAFESVKRVDRIFVSTLQWIDFTSMSNPYNFADKEQTSIPRVTWGKYVLKGERYEMAFDVAGHHALVDGVHSARLINKIQEKIDDIENLK
ncbi:MAG: hypothetical protein IKQ78_01405 [Bacilli bacterium]|nr:hypothetical protein [Bacilli bacterium]